MVTSPKYPIPERPESFLARSWGKLGWKGKTLVCCAAYLLLNFAVVVFSASSHNPANTPAKPDSPNPAARVAAPVASSQTVVGLPAKEAAPEPKARVPQSALLPAIHIWTLDGSRPIVIGDLGCLVCDSASIEKIIDDRSAIVVPLRMVQHDTRDSYGMQTHISFSPQPLLPVVLKSWSTAGKVTGQQVALGNMIFRATGTSDHKTTDGGSVTIYDMEVVNPLVIGDVVRLGFTSATICEVVHDHACIVRPCVAGKGTFDFAPILLRGLPMKGKKAGYELPLGQRFRVVDRPMIDRDGNSLPVYDLEVVKPPSN